MRQVLRVTECKPSSLESATYPVLHYSPTEWAADPPRGSPSHTQTPPPPKHTHTCAHPHPHTVTHLVPRLFLVQFVCDAFHEGDGALVGTDVKKTCAWGVVWRGVVWCGVVWHGVAWRGVVWLSCGVVCGGDCLQASLRTARYHTNHESPDIHTHTDT